MKTLSNTVKIKSRQRKDVKTRVHLATAQHPNCRENCRCDVVWMRMRLGRVARDRAALVSYISSLFGSVGRASDL